MYVALLITALAQGVSLTPDDLKAISDQNIAAVSTLRIRWELERRPTPSQLDFHRASAELFEKELKRGDMPAEIRKKVEAAIKDHKRLIPSAAVVALSKVMTFQQDFWTDGTHFQLRSPIDKRHGTPFQYGPAVSVRFPNVEVKRDELASTFRDIYILSYVPNANGRFRTWDAFDLNSGLHSATVHNTNKHPECFFPPLSRPRPEWGGKPNPIDDFFGQYLGVGKARILGEVKLHGTVTSLIEVQLPADPTGMIRSARAFLDVERAALPLRLEFFNGPIEQSGELLGICYEHSELRASFVVTDIDIRKYENGAVSVWYPRAGVINRLSRATSPAEAVSKAQPDISVHEVTTWHVDQVELDRPMSPENFAFEFPEKTLYVNGPTGELMVTGDADQVAKRYVQGSLSTIPHRNTYRPYWLPAAVSLMAIILALVWWRRKTINK